MSEIETFQIDSCDVIFKTVVDTSNRSHVYTYTVAQGSVLEAIGA